MEGSDELAGSQGVVAKAKLFAKAKSQVVKAKTVCADKWVKFSAPVVSGFSEIDNAAKSQF